MLTNFIALSYIVQCARSEILSRKTFEIQFAMYCVDFAQSLLCIIIRCAIFVSSQ